jgi:hypothetical protein
MGTYALLYIWIWFRPDSLSLILVVLALAAVVLVTTLLKNRVEAVPCVAARMTRVGGVITAFLFPPLLVLHEEWHRGTLALLALEPPLVITLMVILCAPRPGPRSQVDAGLDGRLLHPAVLSIVASLAPVEEARLDAVCSALAGSRVALTQEELPGWVIGWVKALHPYIGVRRTILDRQRREWLRLTADGRRAYQQHRAALWDVHPD